MTISVLALLLERIARSAPGTPGATSPRGWRRSRSSSTTVARRASDRPPRCAPRPRRCSRSSASPRLPRCTRSRPRPRRSPSRRATPSNTRSAPKRESSCRHYWGMCAFSASMFFKVGPERTRAGSGRSRPHASRRPRHSASASPAGLRPIEIAGCLTHTRSGRVGLAGRIRSDGQSRGHVDHSATAKWISGTRPLKSGVPRACAAPGSRSDRALTLSPHSTKSGNIWLLPAPAGGPSLQSPVEISAPVASFTAPESSPQAIPSLSI